MRQNKPIDETGSPRPWYPYAALEWLLPRIQKTDSVFEFGAGYSTVWYGQNAARVIAVEHNSGWLEKVRTMVGPNVTLLHREIRGNEVTSDGPSVYCAAIEEHPAGSFEVIVIDGMERVRCAYLAPQFLRDDGIIVFDNSDRPGFKPAIDYLHKCGFGRVDFYGFVAQAGTRNCTSVFGRFGSRWTNQNVPLLFQGW